MPPAAAAAVADAAKPSAEPDAKPRPPRRPLTKKKLLMLVLGGVLLLAVLAGAALFVVAKKRAAAAAEDGGAAQASHRDSAPPVYAPLDVFTVNLADKEPERFAQVGVTLELDDAAAAERVKTYLPSIRNAILLTLTRKSSAELLGAAGKEQLAREIGREAARAMGYDTPAPRASQPAAAAESFGPIRHVNFANFIIQ